MKFYVLAVILVGGFLSESCQKTVTHRYDFRVKNNLTEKITVRYLKAFQSGNEEVRDILPGEESVLYAEQTETNQKKVYDLYTDSINYFRSMRVMKTATATSTRNNMKSKNEWTFSTKDEDNASYILEIDSFDF